MGTLIGWFFMIVLLPCGIIWGIQELHAQSKNEKEQAEADEHISKLDAYEAYRTPDLPVNYDSRVLFIDVDSARRYFDYNGGGLTAKVNILSHYNSGTVHFWERSTMVDGYEIADFELIDIDFTPEYNQTVTSTTSGRGGQALVGGLVAGPVGAAVGASGKRTTTSNVNSKEIMSWGIITLRNVSNNGSQFGQTFRLRVHMNTEVYNDLMTRFFWNGIEHEYGPDCMPIKA